MKKKLVSRLFILLMTVVVLIWGMGKVDWHHSTTTQCPYCDPHIYQKQLVFQGNSASIIVTHKPAVLGHLLIIPNRHVQQFDQLTQEEIAEMGDLVKRVHQLYSKRFQTSQYLLIQKNGYLAGQSIPHVHVHIMPRTQEMGMISFLARFFISPILKPMHEAAIKDLVESINLW
jgi:histidine triad (HIT) family protein